MRANLMKRTAGLADGAERSLGERIIEISELGSGAELAGTIAHEYRHHWQRQNGWDQPSSVWSAAASPEEMVVYGKRLVKYFRSQAWEMDALRYQLRIAPDDLSTRWKELLIHDSVLV